MNPSFLVRQKFPKTGNMKIKKIRKGDARVVNRLGGKLIPEGERKKTLAINLKQKVIDEMKKSGNPKHIVEAMVNEKFDKLETEE